MPVLAVGAFGGPFTAAALQQVSATTISATQLTGVGHYVAQEAPDLLATVLLQFIDKIDNR